MFSTDAEPEFKEASRQLFLLEAERKDDGEMADNNTMVEKAIRVFCGKNVTFIRLFENNNFFFYN